MKPRNDAVEGMRAPTDTERRMIAEQWRNGTGAGVLRGYQLFLSVVIVILGSFVFGGSGFDLSGGSLLMLAFLLIMAVFVLAWEGFIRKIRIRQKKLENGEFTIAAASGERAATLSSFNFYIGFADVRLGDGTVLTSLHMPYKPALHMRRKRIKHFDAYLVQINGEEKPMAFLRQD